MAYEKSLHVTHAKTLSLRPELHGLEEISACDTKTQLKVINICIGFLCTVCLYV